MLTALYNPTDETATEWLREHEIGNPCRTAELLKHLTMTHNQGKLVVDGKVIMWMMGVAGTELFVSEERLGDDS